MAATTRVDAGHSQSDWPSSRLASRNAYWKLRTRLRNKRAWFWSYGHGLAQQFGTFIRALIRRANTGTDTKSDWFEIRAGAAACGLRSVFRHAKEPCSTSIPVEAPLTHCRPSVVDCCVSSFRELVSVSCFLVHHIYMMDNHVRKGRVRDPCEPIA